MQPPEPDAGRRAPADDLAPPDGDYDAFVIDVVEDGTEQRLDLTIVAGELKGQVVSVASEVSLGDFVDLVGMPATLTVRDGLPSVSIDT